MNVYENDLLLNSETYKKRDCCFEKYLIIPLLQHIEEFRKKRGRKRERKRKSEISEIK